MYSDRTSHTDNKTGEKFGSLELKLYKFRKKTGSTNRESVSALGTRDHILKIIYNIASPHNLI